MMSTIITSHQALSCRYTRAQLIEPRAFRRGGRGDSEEPSPCTIVVSLGACVLCDGWQKGNDTANTTTLEPSNNNNNNNSYS